MSRPFIYLAYARAGKHEWKTDEYLESITDEIREVRETLEQLEKEQKIFQHLEESVSRKRDIKRFRSDEFRETITVFGFSGHAGGGRLVFSDSDVRCEALAWLLSKKRCKKLTLVFLNGCLTNGCMTHFEKEGIPIIISTGMKVSDKYAKDFAITFFQELAKGITVFEAYETAFISVPKIVEDYGGRVRNYRKEHWSNDSLSKVSSWMFNYREEEFKNWTLDIGGDVSRLFQRANSFKEEIDRLKKWTYFFESNSIGIRHCYSIIKELELLQAKLYSSKSTSIFLEQTRAQLAVLVSRVMDFRAVCTYEEEKNLLEREQIIAELGILIRMLGRIANSIN